MDTDFDSEQPKKIIDRSHIHLLSLLIVTLVEKINRKGPAKCRAQGLSPKGLRNPSGQNQVLTCENGRGVAGVPHVAQPIAVPAPLATVPEQEQGVAVAVRVPKDITIEGDYALDLLPFLRNLFLVVPKIKEVVGVERGDCVVCDDSRTTGFAVDMRLTFQPVRRQLHLAVVVEKFESCRARVARFGKRPAFTDEGDRAESGLLLRLIQDALKHVCNACRITRTVDDHHRNLGHQVEQSRLIFVIAHDVSFEIIFVTHKDPL